MSATLPNLNDLSNWLNATLYQTQYRPIKLRECLKYEGDLIDVTKKDNKILFKKIEIDDRIENDPDHLAHLVLETIVQKLGVLVFCPTKARCETLAENIARVIYSKTQLILLNTSFLINYYFLF
jgi:DNA polymerase theta